MVESCQRIEGDDDGHPMGNHSTSRENPETFDDKTDCNNADNPGDDYGGDVSSPFVDEGRRDRGDDINRSHVHKDTVISGDFVVTEKHPRNDENESSTDHSVPADEYDADGLVHRVDSGNATADAMRKEQRGDETLKGPWKLASKGCGNFLVKEGMLHHKEMTLGQEFEQICLPCGRQKQVMKTLS